MSREFAQDFFFQASVERVWQALTTPAEMEKWLGMKVLAFEPRQGGKVHLEGLHPGELVAFEPPHSFTWAWDPDDGSEPVVETLTLFAENGGTRIHLHSVLTGRWGDDLLYRGGNIAGWLDWMEGLAGWVERGQVVSSEPFGLLGAGLGAVAAGDKERIFIKTVKARGAAEAGGLQVGDVLTAWNGEPLNQVATFWRLLWRSPAGTKIRFSVERDGKPLQAEVVLAPRS
jgi:uncharacterized protein YndB with AHSA1/START domain